MKPINTVPIEDFLSRTRIALKSNQKQIVLDIKEATAVADSIALVMTRLSGELEKILSLTMSGQNINNDNTNVQVKLNGGFF